MTDHVTSKTTCIHMFLFAILKIEFLCEYIFFLRIRKFLDEKISHSKNVSEYGPSTLIGVFHQLKTLDLFRL